MNYSAVAALLSGLLFGAGLVVSGMTVPANVVGFLDFAGAWNPSLAFVMGGAIAVHMPLYWLIRKRKSPLFDVQFHVPTRRDIDWRLLAGSAVFGAGWGLGGFCPGPGLVSLASGAADPIIFVGAMTAGVVLYRVIQQPAAAPSAVPIPMAASEGEDIAADA
jgi:uncharacterized membrane protein YedE/YeeE